MSLDREVPVTVRQLVMIIVTGAVSAVWTVGSIIADLPFLVSLIGVILLAGGIPIVFGLRQKRVP